MPFLGRFEAKLDDKNRMAIPAKYREQFDAPAYLTSGDEPCIVVYTKAAFDEEMARVKALSTTTTEGPRLRRKFFSDAHDIAKDTQGRLLIPAPLLAQAGLNKADRDIVIVGNGDWFEVWEPQRWREYQEGGA